MVDGAKRTFLNNNSFNNVFDVICADIKCEHVIVTFKKRKKRNQVEMKIEMIFLNIMTETPFYFYSHKNSHSASHV